MQLPPLDVLLTWPQGNYANPSEVRGPAIVILTAIFAPITVLLVALRIYTRLHLSKNFGADDIAIVTAVFPTLGCAAMTLIAVVHYGWSRHVWDVPTAQLEEGLKYAMAVEVFFATACSLIKISMLLLILRVLATGSVLLRRLSIAVMVVVFLESIIFTALVINTCSPISDYWTLSFAPQKCINETAHLLAGGIINTLTDFCVVLIPIPVVMRLRLPLRQRIYCALLFGAGFVICIAGSFRIVYTYQLNTTYDKTWLAYPTWIAGTIELYMAIIATSIPAIKPFLSRYFPRVLNSNSSGKTGALSSGNLRSLPPHHERSGSEEPLAEPSTEFPQSSTPTMPSTSDVEKGLSFPDNSKGKVLPLTPITSIFSTYRPSSGSQKSVKEKGISLPITAWKNSQPLAWPRDDDAAAAAAIASASSKTSLASFNTVAGPVDQPQQPQPSAERLKATKYVRKEESQEVLLAAKAAPGNSRQ